MPEDNAIHSELTPILTPHHATSPDGKRIEAHGVKITVGNFVVTMSLVGFKDGQFVGDRVDMTENIMKLEDACMALKARIFQNANTTLRKLHERTNEPTGQGGTT